MRTAPLFLLLLAACGGEPATTTEAPATEAAAEVPPAKAEAKPEAKTEAKSKSKSGSKGKTEAAGAATAGDATAGEVVYNQYCVACHQADGTGMNGMLAGNFVADKDRLAKSDEELIASIRDGVTGKIGTMPPWGATLSEQDMANVLAYIRATFGGE